jgi:hypothetical protein
MKAGKYAGERGIVQTVDGEKLVVRLENSGLSVQALTEQVTNFSLAARKAWVTEPGRAVGRRKGTKLYDRVSVTLRLDRDLWQRFQALEHAGVIDDRAALVNAWFGEKLAELDGGERDT